MESIKKSIKTQEDILVNENIKSNLKFKSLVKEYKVTEDEINKNLSSFEDTINELEHCKKCPGLLSCKNHVKGYVYYPQKSESRLTFNYIPCKYLKKYEDDMKNKDADLVLKNARMKDIITDDKNRYKLIKWVTDFFKSYDETKVNKGLYLHGSFGSGKTFVLAALFNELNEKKKANYEIIYFPELLRSLKDNFNLLDSKIRYYANVELLLIDDIGAEKVTDWGRDEILGTILQNRMNNHLTTFFTSNLTIDELEKHLSISKDSQDYVKARRIIERIKQLTEDMELVSMNRRN